MAQKTLKIVIPMAGLGTRLRPFTWSRPKQLIQVAGKTILAHVLDMFASLPESVDAEFVFVVGHLGEQLPPYMAENHPSVKVHYVEQRERKGQSHAIYVGRDYLDGPMLMVFADTLVDADFSSLLDEEAEAVAWVKDVPDPRHFGVAIVDEGGWVTQLIEKPTDVDNNLAVVGFYYFQDSATLLGAIEEQMAREIQLKGEYYLADAVNILLARGLWMRTEPVRVWIDAGTPESLLETNRYLLANGGDNSVEAAQRPEVAVIPPVYIHPSADVRASVVGPSVSIGAGCQVENSVIRNSILEAGAQVSAAVIERSLLGCEARFVGRTSIITLGDHSEMSG